MLCSIKPKGVSTVRLGLRFGTSFLFLALILISGCAVQPAQDGTSADAEDLASAGADDESIELCRCPEDEQVDDFTVALGSKGRPGGRFPFRSPLTVARLFCIFRKFSSNSIIKTHSNCY